MAFFIIYSVFVIPASAWCGYLIRDFIVIHVEPAKRQAERPAKRVERKRVIRGDSFAEHFIEISR